ncbi:MAG: hypothetical protein LKE89_04885 [Lactobacillaceae bacterium]|jgi:uncharacterized protein YggU (UPF0235/DUF167 family)|nr:hypothetical protein [Lactobacillaceae bacterium]
MNEHKIGVVQAASSDITAGTGSTVAFQYPQYIPEHPENGADPTPDRWAELVANWDQWYGGSGFNAQGSKEIIPGNKIWPEGTSTAVWPLGSDYDSLNKFVTRTIRYYDQATNESIAVPVQQQVHFGSSMIIDLVTGENLGYAMPDSTGVLSSKPVTPHKSDSWYAVGLSEFPQVGSPDLSAKGYVNPTLAVVPSQTPVNGAANSEIIVYYQHQLTSKKLVKNVTQTIHYVDATGKQIAADNHQVVALNGELQTDLVTKQTTTTWNSGAFKDVVTPVIAGYTADTNVVVGSKVAATSQDRTVTVSYRKNQVTAATASTPADSSVNQAITNRHTVSQAKQKVTVKSRKLPQTNERQAGHLPVVLGMLLILLVVGVINVNNNPDNTRIK